MTRRFTARPSVAGNGRHRPTLRRKLFVLVVGQIDDVDPDLQHVVHAALAEADPIDLAQLNLKRPAEPTSVLAGWASGIAQKPGSLTSHFNFPLGASFEF